MHLGYINCYSDVTTLMDARCSALPECHVRVPDAEFEATRPCLKELKTYLEVSYACVPGKYGRGSGYFINGRSRNKNGTCVRKKDSIIMRCYILPGALTTLTFYKLIWAMFS
ncbi:hypothetical protein HELRODRAFT_179479 [Helobdella robusta]|uniref:SUEL-type lectin domain-containing protein n=1 Tax=Helobdella robusta TaxID=6412 RepID=T1FER9_HELRO|nr:hypothetical protein HELRODRAFT_179479 [Helobdella robusta]ESN95405.1 hypothetical protein HELRODRAFT_179479 [Helobdella robusta]